MPTIDTETRIPGCAACRLDEHHNCVDAACRYTSTGNGQYEVRDQR